MKLPTGIVVLCLYPKKKEEITSISRLSLTVHCLAQRKNLEIFNVPLLAVCQIFGNTFWLQIIYIDPKPIHEGAS